MSTPLLETQLHKPGVSEALGCLLAVPLVLAVVVAVNLFIGEEQLPREIRGTTPWFLLGTVITGAGAGWFWKRSQIQLAVVEIDGEPWVEVHDPNSPLVLKGPFDVRYGYAQIHLPKVGKQTLVIVGLYVDGELELSLVETWGSAYSPPVGWPGDFALEGQAKASYTAAGRSFLLKLVDLLT